MGLSAAHQCAKAGQSTLCVEKFNFFNQSGSSNDLTRMFRTMYTEDYMADLAYDIAYPLWGELEEEADEVGNLIQMSGLLNFGNPNYGAGGPEGTLLDPIDNLIRKGMDYTHYANGKEIMDAYPCFKNLPYSY